MKFFKNILIAAGVFVVFLLLAMLFMNWFTRHGESIEVPNIEGMPIENAYNVIEGVDMELVVIDSVYKDDMKPMTIVEQDPKPEMKVKSGRKIYVVLNTGKKPKVKMPKLTNGSSNLAIVLLKNSGLKLGKVDSVKSTFGSGLVIKQKYKNQDVLPNTLLEKGSIIDIVVSKKISNADTSEIQKMKDGVSVDNE
ncbi:MAG: PASTA domain-containing protein [Bacteroidota bacterium]|nr:PASTA domain-containing protein [Bacteroidota bacterium]